MPPQGCQRKRSPRRQTRPGPHGLCRLRNLAGDGDGPHEIIRCRRPGVGAAAAGRDRMTHSGAKQTGEGVAYRLAAAAVVTGVFSLADAAT